MKVIWKSEYGVFKVVFFLFFKRCAKVWRISIVVVFKKGWSSTASFGFFLLVSGVFFKRGERSKFKKKRMEGFPS